MIVSFSIDWRVMRPLVVVGLLFVLWLLVMSEPPPPRRERQPVINPTENETFWKERKTGT